MRREENLKKLTDFLQKLERAKIYFSLDYTSEDSITVLAVVPGQRWEIQFMADGEVAVEKFLSDGRIFEEGETEKLLKDFSE